MRQVCFLVGEHRLPGDGIYGCVSPADAPTARRRSGASGTAKVEGPQLCGAADEGEPAI